MCLPLYTDFLALFSLFCVFQIFREFERFGGDAPLQTVTAVAQLQMATVLDVAAKRVEKATWDILERVDTCSKEDQHCESTSHVDLI